MNKQKNKTMARYACRNGLVVMLMILASGLNINAQEKTISCSEALSVGNKEYEAGHFNMCIETLKPCVSHLGINESFEAYRLLALCYLALNDEKNTHDAVVHLLKAKPDYRDFPFFDPLDFTKLLAKYEVWPKLEIGMKVGLNFNTVHPINNYSMTGSAAEYLPQTGFQTGILAEFYVRKNVSVNVEVLYEGLSYTRTATDVSGWKQ